MSSPAADVDLAALAYAAGVLLPGDGASPPATDVPGYLGLLERAVAAIGPERTALTHALAQLPVDCTLADLQWLSEQAPVEFDVLAATVAGAYFMSDTVRRSIGYPTGRRRASPFGQAADELGGGLLDPVLSRSYP